MKTITTAAAATLLTLTSTPAVAAEDMVAVQQDWWTTTNTTSDRDGTETTGGAVTNWPLIAGDPSLECGQYATKVTTVMIGKRSHVYSVLADGRLDYGEAGNMLKHITVKIVGQTNCDHGHLSTSRDHTVKRTFQVYGVTVKNKEHATLLSKIDDDKRMTYKEHRSACRHGLSWSQITVNVRTNSRAIDIIDAINAQTPSVIGDLSTTKELKNVTPGQKVTLAFEIKSPGNANHPFGMGKGFGKATMAYYGKGTK